MPQPYDLLGPAIKSGLGIAELQMGQERMGLLRQQMESEKQLAIQKEDETFMKRMETVIDLAAKGHGKYAQMLATPYLSKIKEKYPGFELNQLNDQDTVKSFSKGLTALKRYGTTNKEEDLSEGIEALANAGEWGAEALKQWGGEAWKPEKREFQTGAGGQVFEATGEPGTQLTPVTPAGAIGGENITGQFITDKGVTVGFSDTGGAIAYTTNAQGNMQIVPYNQAIHGKKIKEPPVQVNIGDTGGKVLVTETIKQLPKLKEDADIAATGISSINTALNLLEKGVTGKGGQVKAFLAPYAETLGYTGEDLSDAQAYQLLTRAIVGPMRLQIIGAGPVSDFEQKLMMQISGGGGTAKEAARMLLNHWGKVSRSKVNSYNSTLKGIQKTVPEVSNIYSPVNIKNIVERRVAKDGRVLIKYDDGTIEEEK